MPMEPSRPSMGDDEPAIRWHEVLRCTRGDETRIYRLRAVAGGAELWRITECPGEKTRSVKESDFSDADQTSQFLEEVRRTLKAGGWQET
jgi:hypothetical protein